MEFSLSSSSLGGLENRLELSSISGLEISIGLAPSLETFVIDNELCKREREWPCSPLTPEILRELLLTNRY